MATGPAAASELASQLLVCLVDELAGTVAGDVCRAHLSPGTSVTADQCCDCNGGQGQASVRVAQLYPTASFPTPLADLSRCWAMTWAAQFELVVFRCAATVDKDGEAPPADAVGRDATVVLSDAAAMARAVSCCFPDGCCGPGVLPGTWNPVGPSGGCVGGALTVLVDLGAA